MLEVEIRHFHLFCGLGGGAKGFNRGQARVGSQEAVFRCIGGIDVEAPAIQDFNRMAGAKGTVMDLFSREQYAAFHGHEPPADWKAATPSDIRKAAGNERPNIVFTSPPCKGFSGLLNSTLSKSAKYRALNELTLRGLWLALEAWADDPVEFFLLENVPRISTRGADLLASIEELLHTYGYVTAMTEHDCGELGGLGQRRKRFLLVARHAEKVPPFLYEPMKKPLKSVGDVLHRFSLPGDPRAGGMHQLPRLQWKTWVRLALIEAGGDWRSLQKLNVERGQLTDYAIVPDGPEWHRGILGVTPWDETGVTVTGRGTPCCGKFSVADPRMFGKDYQQYGVLNWDQTSGTLTGQSAPGGGRFSIADPRMLKPHYKNVYRVLSWDQISGTVTTGTSPSNGGMAIADPRCNWSEGAHRNKLALSRWEDTTRAVIGARGPYSGALSIADPRIGWDKDSENLKHSNSALVGRPGVNDGNSDGVHQYMGNTGLPDINENLVAVICALDGTWHRPFTTLELAALQGLVDPEEHMELYGTSDKGWRERIGNAVPPPAAEAIAGVMGKTLLLAWSGETFALDAMPIWVKPLAISAAVDGHTAWRTVS